MRYRASKLRNLLGWFMVLVKAMATEGCLDTIGGVRVQLRGGSDGGDGGRKEDGGERAQTSPLDLVGLGPAPTGVTD